MCTFFWYNFEYKNMCHKMIASRSTCRPSYPLFLESTYLLSSDIGFHHCSIWEPAMHLKKALLSHHIGVKCLNKVKGWVCVCFIWGMLVQRVGTFGSEGSDNWCQFNLLHEWVPQSRSHSCWSPVLCIHGSSPIALSPWSVAVMKSYGSTMQWILTACGPWKSIVEHDSVVSEMLLETFIS